MGIYIASMTSDDASSCSIWQVASWQLAIPHYTGKPHEPLVQRVFRFFLWFFRDAKTAKCDGFACTAL